MTRDVDRSELWFCVFQVMDILAPYLFTLLVLIAMASCAHAAPCLPSADAVKALHKGSWPTWSGRVQGHLGEQCWMTKEERQVMRSAGTTKTNSETRPVRATRAALTETVALAPPPRWILADRFEVKAPVNGNLERALMQEAAMWRIAQGMR